MSGNDELSGDEERDLEDDEEYSCNGSSEEEEALSAEDRRLFTAVLSDDADAAEAVQQAIRDGANVNAVLLHYDGTETTPLMIACRYGYDQTIRILLDAGADARWRTYYSYSTIAAACDGGHLSAVQQLINHENGLLEFTGIAEWTPLFHASIQQHSDITRFLLDSGADPHHVDQEGGTALMQACQFGSHDNARLLLDAGVDVDARNEYQQTALHYAALRGDIEVVRELILQHNANMFALNRIERAPFDEAFYSGQTADVIDHLLEMYGNKLTQDHGSLALHELLKVAIHSFTEDRELLFHPPLNPLRIILPLGYITLKHWRTLLHTLDPEVIRNRDDTGKLPIHIACRTNAPVEVLALILELDPTTLHIADSTGALPIHLLCGTTARAEYASVRYLVEQGGIGILAARNRHGLLPLHVLCESRNAPLRVVQYLIQSFPGSVAVQTNAGQYPFMMAAAADSCSASLSVIYELVRANPSLVVPR